VPGEPGESLQISVSRRDQAIVAALAGSADIDQADSVRDSLMDLARQAAAVLVLDLRQLTFICSRGLGALIQAHTTCRSLGGQVRLVQPTGPVMRVLEATRLTEIMPVYASIEQALQTG